MNHKMILRSRTKTVPKPVTITTTATTNNNNWCTRLPHLNEDIQIEILSRLPVKSLMRFKSVSKPWKSLFSENPKFRNLHFSHSEKRRCLLVVPEPIKIKSEEKGFKMNRYVTASLSLENEGTQTTTMHVLPRKESESNLIYDDIIGPVNGLFGVVKNFTSVVTIYNFSTQEVVQQCSTPTLLTQLKKNPGYYRGDAFQVYFFGYDTTTMKYKVICVWGVSEVGSFRRRRACEVFTLDSSNTWETIIDELVPEWCFQERYAYANNSFYWRSSVEDLSSIPLFEEQLAKIDTSTGEVLLALDLGIEKFRVIPVPSFVPSRSSKFYLPHPNGDEIQLYPVLQEVNGRVVISYRSDFETIQLYVLDDDCVNKESADTTGNMVNWTKESIELPNVLHSADVDIYSLPGTDDILLICNFGHAKIKHPSFYSYSRKKKTLKSIIYDKWGSMFHYPYMYSTFVESLSPFRA